MKKIYNFNAGPSMLPKEVLLKAKKDLLNWNNLGVSVMEISHRSFDFIELTNKIKKNLISLLNIPKSYEILFSPGGARGQFSAIPINIINNWNNISDYIVGGYWSNEAFLESQKYCFSNKINIRKNFYQQQKILSMKNWKLNKNSKYIHYCPNETIEGIEIFEDPISENFNNKIIIGDFSSTILSKPINIKYYDIIYAGVQKNIGPPGITLIIIKKNLFKKNKITPSVIYYKNLLKYDSMFNTPATFSWYISGLVIKWLKKKGGLKKINIINYKKANLLYNYIDKSDFYFNNIHKNNRSLLNITFNIINPFLNNFFLKESKFFGFLSLKGHNLIGGMRASIYNAMPIKGIKKLIKFMKYFKKKYG